MAYNSSSDLVIESSSYSPLVSGTITTHGGRLFIQGFVYGTLTSGIAYLYVKIDDSQYKIGQYDIHNTEVPLNGIGIVSDVSAGTHTISFGVTRQDGTNRTFTVGSYTDSRVLFIEC